MARDKLAKIARLLQSSSISTSGWKQGRICPREVISVLSEDFPREVRGGRKLLFPDLIAAREAEHTAWIVYPCRLFMNGKEKRVINPATINVRAR